MTHLYLEAFFHLEFKRLFPHPRHPTAYARFICIQEDAMFLHSSRSGPATLAGQANAADEATSELLTKIVVATERRLSLPSQAASAARLRQLIEAGALTEAAFALIDLELPQWKLRRITYDGGEWHCAMSRERELPEWLDEAVEARHASLTLAILSAYIETIRQIESSKDPRRPSVPQIRAEQYEPLCCENFA